MLTNKKFYEITLLISKLSIALKRLVIYKDENFMSLSKIFERKQKKKEPTSSPNGK
jgi:hypothetical protein